MTQSRLYKIRNVKRQRTLGKSWQEAADAVGVSIPTARKMYDEYWDNLKAGTLFSDQPAYGEEDLYNQMSIVTRRHA